MDKFVKLDAIEKMAKPMSAFHGGAKPSMEEDAEMCECPKCGHTFTMARPEMEEESEDEYEMEDE